MFQTGHPVCGTVLLRSIKAAAQQALTARMPVLSICIHEALSEAESAWRMHESVQSCKRRS